jgi:hypothetical protein
LTKKFYTDLGLAEDCSQADIRAAYRRAASAHHPDRAGGDAEKFKAASLAYETLFDPEKRKAYDEGQINDEGKKEKTVEEEALFFFGELVKACINRGGNLRVLMREQGNAAWDTVNKEHSNLQKKIARIEKKLTTVVFKGKGKNLLREVLKQELALCKASLIQGERMLAVIKRLQALISDYNDTDDTPEPSRREQSVEEKIMEAFGLKL